MRFRLGSTPAPACLASPFREGDGARFLLPASSSRAPGREGGWLTSFHKRSPLILLLTTHLPSVMSHQPPGRGGRPRLAWPHGGEANQPDRGCPRDRCRGARGKREEPGSRRRRRRYASEATSAAVGTECGAGQGPPPPLAAGPPGGRA